MYILSYILNIFLVLVKQPYKRLLKMKESSKKRFKSNYTLIHTDQSVVMKQVINILIHLHEI